MSERELIGDARVGGSPASGEAPPQDPPEEMVMHLERDQLVAETFRPVAHAQLGPRATAALWTLRAFAVLVSLMVIYAFLERLS